MRQVLRWQVMVNDEWQQIGGGRVLHVASREGGIVEVWTEEVLPLFPETDGAVIRTPRRARVFGTGQPLPPGAQQHLGTTFDASTPALVWHLFAEEPF